MDPGVRPWLSHSPGWAGAIPGKRKRKWSCEEAVRAAMPQLTGGLCRRGCAVSDPGECWTQMSKGQVVGIQDWVRGAD